MSSEQQAQTGPRRRIPLVTASVAVAVLLVGGGGAYLASAAGDGGAPSSPGAPGGSPPPLSLGSGTDATSGGTGSGPAGIAPGEPDPYGRGPVVYRATGTLPKAPATAPVYRAQGAVGADEVARLAKALGVKGTPRLTGGSWQVGALPDGTGSQLRVTERAPGTWTFARHSRPNGTGSTDCLRGKQCTSGTPVGEEAAKRAAAPVLNALGLDGAKLDATQVLGGSRVVNADPVVGGLPTYGWTTGIPVGPDGDVVGGSGNLKALAKGAAYPAIGADRAIELLNRVARGPRPGIGGCADPVPVREKETPGATPEPGPPVGKILPCEPRKTPQRTVNVASATFGLAVQYADGQQMLVPSWLLRVAPEGGGAQETVTYPAVDPKFLKAPEPPKQDPATPAPGTVPDRKVESYTTDGKRLTLGFWGGVCSEYAAKAVEDGGVVKVRVVETNPDPKRICIAIAKKLTASVELSRPLDGRQVVGEDGKAVPKG
ncbi:membrane protein [Streptomyces spiroverticillatus]|uniref:Membrane protein n=1 Tax=Streptomyces finlayi TaxID=67296 RepID=A0A918WX24_9ACTN|nr:hypothetical protein [Streptomyces finlayi]GGZ93627.1 membrane protein [Streptomyces spiroverticillatus]GHC92181.1 membrane protein [Streptomyces finlayi]